MSADEPGFKTILLESSTAIAALAWKTRSLILKAAPEATEVISMKDRVAGYGYSAKVRGQLIYIALPQDWVRLGFYYGGELPDPDHLLEGTGKRLRHIKLRAEEDLNKSALLELLQRALVRDQSAD